MVLPFRIAIQAISFILLFLFTSNIFAQGVITHTIDADFNKGNINNVLVSTDNIILPYQATNLDSWSATTSLPQILRNHKLSYWNERVYVTGGLKVIGYSGDDEVYETSNDVYVADVSTDIGTWSTLANLPYGISDHSVIAANGYLYVIGGKIDGNPTDSIYYAKINSNGTIDSWLSCSIVLPQPLWGHTI